MQMSAAWTTAREGNIDALAFGPCDSMCFRNSPHRFNSGRNSRLNALNQLPKRRAFFGRNTTYALLAAASVLSCRGGACEVRKGPCRLPPHEASAIQA